MRSSFRIAALTAGAALAASTAFAGAAVAAPVGFAPAQLPVEVEFDFNNASVLKLDSSDAKTAKGSFANKTKGTLYCTVSVSESKLVRDVVDLLKKDPGAYMTGDIPADLLDRNEKAAEAGHFGGEEIQVEAGKTVNWTVEFDNDHVEKPTDFDAGAVAVCFSTDSEGPSGAVVETAYEGGILGGGSLGGALGSLTGSLGS